MRLDRGAGFISKAEQQIKGNHFCLKGKTAEGRYHPLLYSRYTSWDAAEYAADCHFSKWSAIGVYRRYKSYIEDINEVLNDMKIRMSCL